MPAQSPAEDTFEYMSVHEHWTDFILEQTEANKSEERGGFYNINISINMYVPDPPENCHLLRKIAICNFPEGQVCTYELIIMI